MPLEQMPASPIAAKTILSQCGTCVAQSHTDWQGPFELPPQIADFYLEVGPRNIELCLAGGNETILPSLELLWDYQIGYRVNGITGERIPEWPDSWLVVAHRAGESFIFDKTTGSILHALPGAAKLGMPSLFECINTMAASLASLELVQPDFNDDFEMLPKYRVPLLHSIEPFVGGRNDAERVLKILGYDYFAETNELPPDPPKATPDEIATTRAKRQAEGEAARLRYAIRDSKVAWQQKDFQAVIRLLEPYEEKLELLSLKRLAYCRNKVH